MNESSIYSVSQINSHISRLILGDVVLSSVIVKGEVGSCKYHPPTRYTYFSLKDEKSVIDCVIRREDQSKIKTEIKTGDKVLISGHIDCYIKGGKYQLIAKDIRQEGEGDLQEKLRELTARLAEAGMFDSMYKKDIPPYGMRIGIVTSESGAVIHDIKKTAIAKNPYVKLILCPALVQGENAPASIANGIKRLDEYGVDTIIVCRGGGSKEDLMPFNDEAVAYAIFNSNTPVISAVGHGSDSSIADLVADRHVVTPTAAAELAVFDVNELIKDINIFKSRLNNHLVSGLDKRKSVFDTLAMKIRYMSPVETINRKKSELKEYTDRINRSIDHELTGVKDYVSALHGIFDTRINKEIERRKYDLMSHISKYDALSPLKRLEQGFSYSRFKDGGNISSVKNVKTGDEIEIVVKDGIIKAVTQSIKNN